ncbi:hypothetical protein PROH_07140 [Prochlorothrix hollandica PCC 9006 = CALU 1027]|uniref:Uncharacterized protein n=1 Tax=Prochlorothrix hollandica PCC 9006 = CALU 1027 TaxID=317619 RepID=A0A0M2PYA4_PROHO|nr:hypothetical protein PROH_07140 [Prochlorothrix hollandica PCC 9006 = CALU 1027]
MANVMLLALDKSIPIQSAFCKLTPECRGLNLLKPLKVRDEFALLQGLVSVRGKGLKPLV